MRVQWWVAAMVASAWWVTVGPLEATAGLPVRITSDVANAEIVVEGIDGARTGLAPLVLGDVPSGRYDVWLYREGTTLSKARLEVGNTLRMPGSRGSRAFLSAVFPGLGQVRDFGMIEAVVPMGSVGWGVGRSLLFQKEMSQSQELLDDWVSLTAFDRGVSAAEYNRTRFDLSDEVEVDRKARNNYMALTGVLHVGNILHAGVRRGAYRIDLSSSNSLAARHRPSSRTGAVALSALWPGLGQTRLGHNVRGHLWHLTAAITGTLVVEFQRELDQDRATVAALERRLELELGGAVPPTPGENTAALLSLARADTEGSRSTRQAAVFGAVALWVLNLADTWFKAEPTPVPTTQANSRNLRLDVTWIGEGPGVSFGGSF